MMAELKEKEEALEVVENKGNIRRVGVHFLVTTTVWLVDIAS